ncbi:MAG: TMEM175 family protein [Chthoniobacterales bacterium]
MAHESGVGLHDRFTSRLEAFSDLVFGFSLSLLATRLDVPTRPEEIFNVTRWLAIIGTFAFVCRFWLEHYRIFRHHFVADMTDAVINFVFLFAIAILPYALLTFLRFKLNLPAFTLYLGDFALLLASLGVLRVRSLRQRRHDPDVADRLRQWRRSLIQFQVALILSAYLVALRLHGGAFTQAMLDLQIYLLIAFALCVLMARLMVRRLPRFLSA